MKKQYKISEKALNDLEKIWLYTVENWSVQQADRYHNLLVAEIEYISKYFESGRSMDYIKDSYKASKIKSHFIFYRKDDNGIIQIVRILHERMDIKNILK